MDESATSSYGVLMENGNRQFDRSRRQFFSQSAMWAGAALLRGPLPALASPPVIGKFTGIQISAISFVDEGVIQVLDILQGKGGVNALFISAFTYDRGTGGR